MDGQTVPLANLWIQLISTFQTEVTLKKTDEEGGQLFHNIREPPWQLVGRFCHGGFKLKILCKANSSQKLSLTQHSTSLLTYMRMIWMYLLLLNHSDGWNEKYIFDRDLQLMRSKEQLGRLRFRRAFTYPIWTSNFEANFLLHFWQNTFAIDKVK